MILGFFLFPSQVRQKYLGGASCMEGKLLFAHHQIIEIILWLSFWNKKNTFLTMLKHVGSIYKFHVIPWYPHFFLNYRRVYPINSHIYTISNWVSIISGLITILHYIHSHLFFKTHTIKNAVAMQVMAYLLWSSHDLAIKWWFTTVYGLIIPTRFPWYSLFVIVFYQ